MKFSIGETVWYANRGSSPKYLPCPDCLGNKYIKAIIADGTEYTIDCQNCERGYHGSLGFIETYELSGYASQDTIIGVKIDSNKGTVYTSHSFYEVGEDEVFATKEEAEKKAEEHCKEATEAEHKRILTKEKDTKTWAWNVTYHRKCVKQAQKELEYHTAKLNIAKSKAKGTE